MQILIAGIGRNIANSIPFLKATFEGIASQAAECAVVIYENNSTDRSSELLRAWSAQDPRVRARSEYISPEEQLNQGKARTWDNQPCRRNRRLDGWRRDCAHYSAGARVRRWRCGCFRKYGRRAIVE